MVEMSLENNDIPHSSKKNSPFWRILAIISAALVFVCAGCGTNTSSVSPTAPPSPTTIEIQVATFATEPPTPIPTPTLAQRIQKQAYNDAANAISTSVYQETQLKSSYDKSSNTDTISMKMSGGDSNDTIKTEIKTDCFNVQSAIWQDKSLSLHTLIVQINDDLVDKYGNKSVGPVGICTLNKDTASLIQWSNVDYTIWDNTVYDDTWLLPSLNQ